MKIWWKTFCNKFCVGYLWHEKNYLLRVHLLCNILLCLKGSQLRTGFFIPQHSADLTAIRYFRATFRHFLSSVEGNVVDLFATMLITLTNSPYSKPNIKVVFELISHSSHRPAICIFNVYLTLWKNY